jgi:hypothetical protein
LKKEVFKEQIYGSIKEEKYFHILLLLMVRVLSAGLIFIYFFLVLRIEPMAWCADQVFCH